MDGINPLTSPTTQPEKLEKNTGSVCLPPLCQRERKRELRQDPEYRERQRDYRTEMARETRILSTNQTNSSTS